jgi:hypothetical protein
LFLDALYGRLSPEQTSEWEEHRKSCEKCAARFAAMADTLQVMGRRERIDPGQQFWDGYWTKLAERMDREREHPRPKKTAFPAWMLQIAAVLLLVGVGVLIGKFYFGDHDIPRTAVPVTTPPSAVLPANEQRASRFLEKSETVLLALVNFDPDREAAETLNLKRQKEVSQQLVREASYLQGELTKPEDRKLQKLVTDLQVILLQIANLEEREDFPEIDLVKGGVDRKGILLKINLQQMKMTSEQATDSRPEPEPGKSGI